MFVGKSHVMKKLFPYIFSLLAITLIPACSAEKKFANRLRGQWQIARYDVNDARIAAQAFTNLGTITFHKNHTGEVDMKNIFTQNRKAGASRIEWSNTENSVTIRGEEPELAKAWIVVTNKKKTQLWKSTDGFNRIQEIELKR